MSKQDRDRRYRERQKKGIQLATIEVSQEMVEILLMRRVLKVDDCGNPRAIAEAITRLTYGNGMSGR